MEPNGCPLCAAEKITRWYYEDERIWVADCLVCWVPMVVLKEHGLGTRAQFDYMVLKARELFGDDCYLDPHMRLIPDHRHFHVRGYRRPRGSYHLGMASGEGRIP